MKLRIEKLIDPNIDPMNAALQTSEPWCSVLCGSFAVFGTDDLEEARAFVREVVAAVPRNE